MDEPCLLLGCGQVLGLLFGLYGKLAGALLNEVKLLTWIEGESWLCDLGGG